MQANVTEAIRNGKFNRTMPADFGHLISQAKYDTIIDVVLNYFKKESVRILSLEDGVLCIADAAGIQQSYSFFNLVRHLGFIPVADWKTHIYEFLDMKVNTAAYGFFMKDYEHARRYLKVLVKPAGFLKGSRQQQMVVKEHFPGTCSFLVFNYEQKFIYLERNHIREWNVSDEELFDQALLNIAQEKMYTKCRRLEAGQKLYIVLSHEYSAARMIKLEENEPQMIGACGTLFTIPANGVAFVMPIKDPESVSRALKPLMNITLEAYRIEPSPILLDVFHWCEGECISMLDYLKNHHPDIYSRVRPRN